LVINDIIRSIVIFKFYSKIFSDNYGIAQRGIKLRRDESVIINYGGNKAKWLLI